MRTSVLSVAGLVSSGSRWRKSPIIGAIFQRIFESAVQAGCSLRAGGCRDSPTEALSGNLGGGDCASRGDGDQQRKHAKWGAAGSLHPAALDALPKASLGR